MAYIITDAKRREAQEERDYKIFEGITKELFKKYRIEKQPDVCSVDVRLTGYTKNSEKHYCVELKWQNNMDYNIREHGGPYIKVEKYLYMQNERRNDETSIIVYICNDGRYFLYNVDDVIGNVPTKNLNTKAIKILDSQYHKDGYNNKSWQWVYILPTDQAKIKGEWLT